MDAYAFARGAEIGLPPLDLEGRPHRTATIDRPLDFLAVTDHAEFLGEVEVCSTPGLPGYDSFQCRVFRDFTVLGWNTLQAGWGSPPSLVRHLDLCGPGGEGCVGPATDAWSEVRSAAEEAQDPTPFCGFSAFAGYEWSGSPLNRNLHRNVVFRDDRVPGVPTSYFEEPHPEGLWDALERTCTGAGTGCDVITIPHNSNVSSGWMFAEAARASGSFDAAYAERRARFEPLIEVFQAKGDSECHPLGSPTDELCGFEKLPFPGIGGFGEGTPPPTTFVRNALGRGLGFDARLGANPFRYGLIGSTDNHVSTPGHVVEATYPGHAYPHPSSLPGPDPVAEPPSALVDRIVFNPGGLAVLWAEENSRASLFDAMVRREAYATSGPRMVLRFFGGSGLPADLCDDPELVRIGYEGGVPMGGELDAGSLDGASPTFVVSAVRDPGTATAPGGRLQRIQIVKGRLDASGEAHEEVHEVAGDPANGASVDLETCTPVGPGFDALCATWRDPDFDPGERAFWYARVIENPSCRWSTYQCRAAGVDCDDPASVPPGFEECCEDLVPPTIQERAWSSPIWYGP